MRLVRSPFLVIPLCVVALSGCTSPAVVGESTDSSVTAPDVIATPDVVTAPDASDACASTGIEVCDGVDNDCNGQIDEGFCRIGGVCFTNGQRNPANTCQVCTLTSSTASGPTAWSNVAAGTVCRPSAGVCDVSESCAGAGAPCPADAFVAASVACRASSGPCDAAETCTGSSAACPVDALAPGGATTYARSASPLTFIDACAAPGARRGVFSADESFLAEGLPFSFRYYGVAPGLLAEVLHPGLALRVTALRGRVMIPAELTLDAPGRLEDAQRSALVWALPWSVGVGVCPRFGARVVLFACGTLSVGALVAWGNGYSTDRTDVAYTAAAGARVAVEVPLTARWRFVASLDARALLLRPAIEVRGSASVTLWTASPFAASLAIGVAWQNL